MKRKSILISATALLVLVIPAIGLAQSYGYGSERRNDRRQLKESVKSVDKLSGRLKSDLDRALDKSRLDGTNREDRLNQLAGDFHAAASKFRDKFDDGHYERAEAEARKTLALGWQLDALIGDRHLSGRTSSDWSRIRSDLTVIQDAYGHN